LKTILRRWPVFLLLPFSDPPPPSVAIPRPVFVSDDQDTPPGESRGCDYDVHAKKAYRARFSLDSDAASL
jgi:hypothetical protein